jgi:hypothetical protein
MSLKLTTYADDDFKKWETFIDNSQNGTLFDKISFINYHGTNKFNQLRFIILNEDNTIVSVLLASIEIDSFGKKQLTAPFGASIGGPVFTFEAKYNNFEEVVSSIIEYSLLNRINRIKFRVAPEIYNYQNNSYLSFVLFKLGFRITNTHLTFIVNLKGNYTQKIPQRKLRYLKQSKEKNDLKIRQCDVSYLDNFYHILLENRKKFSAHLTHSPEDLKFLLTQCKERVKLFLTFYEEEPIAGGLIFELTSKVVYLFYLCHYEEYEKFRASLFMAYGLQEYYSRLGFHYFDYGPSSSDDLTLNKGGVKFKEELGASGYTRNTWVLNLC